MAIPHASNRLARTRLPRNNALLLTLVCCMSGARCSSDTGEQSAANATAGTGESSSAASAPESMSAGAAGRAPVAGMPARAASAGGGSGGRASTAGDAGAFAAGSGGRASAADSGGQGDAGRAGAAATAGRGAAGSVASAGAHAPSSNAYAPCPAAPEPCKLLPFGDSITFGIGFSGGYRVELFRKAVTAGQHVTFLGSQSNGPNMVDGQTFPKQNEGHSGWKIAQLEPLIPSPALSTVPDIVLLMIGTNDIAQRDNLSAAPDRLSKLLDKLKGAAPKALIVLAQITPLSNTGSKEAIEAYNAAVRDIATKRAAAGEHITLVDMYTGFPTSELGDGVHPNEKGYARMAAVWYAAIGGVLH